MKFVKLYKSGHAWSKNLFLLKVIHRYNIRNSKNIGPNSLLHFLPNVNDQGFAFLKISSSSYSFFYQP